ncbi:hypothetical protein [Massilia sp. Leaf139]|uniref:hypothetical protein n=1 Tax=Massilia sp. Leaf139 TaxID=1736272 RepID=UPI0006FD3437|nr:hypothetical protein [Massilia sp. Leaf139]KQQ96146.1 hypothetical protein ASF77_21825 [Massilia sp. Leaf139]
MRVGFLHLDVLALAEAGDADGEDDALAGRFWLLVVDALNHLDTGREHTLDLRCAACAQAQTTNLRAHALARLAGCAGQLMVPACRGIDETHARTSLSELAAALRWGAAQLEQAIALRIGPGLDEGHQAEWMRGRCDSDEDVPQHAPSAFKTLLLGCGLAGQVLPGSGHELPALIEHMRQRACAETGQPHRAVA